MYLIKYGNIDNKLSKVVPNLIHSVFMNGIHGNCYAYVSKWLSEKYGNNAKFVPHMIDLPNIIDNMRDELKIPQDAIVFGSYGGRYSFDIDFVKQCVNDIVKYNKNIYFLFMNFDHGTTIKHDRIIYLPGNVDRKYKVKMINTCDAMIHARKIGETFGLSIGEFSSKNKPIITYKSPNNDCDKEHIRILGKKGLYYTNYNELYNLLNTFTPEPNKDWNCYSEYTPNKVMRIFEDVFLNTEIINDVKTNCVWKLFKNDGISREVMRGNIWKPHLFNLMKTLIKPGNNFLDVGSNFGYYTVLLSKLCGINSMIYSIEPNPVLYNRLLNNINLNNLINVIPLKVALGNQTRTINTFNRVNWTILFQNMGMCNMIGGDCTVQEICGDSLNISKLEFIKINTQGYELFVIEGLETIIKNLQPILFMEIQDNSLKNFNCSRIKLLEKLKSLNYYVFFIHSQYPADYICVPNNKIKEFRTNYNLVINTFTEQSIHLGVTEYILI